MNHITELDRLTRLTRRREFEDGLLDLLLGFVFLVLGLAGWFIFSFRGIRWLAVALAANREITLIGLIAAIPLFFLALVGTRRWFDHLRRNTIWKDRGFVKSLRWQVSWQTNLAAVGTGLAMLILAFVLAGRGLISQDAVLRTLVASMGVSQGIVFFGVGKGLQLQRYLWVGIIGGLFSAALLLLPVSFAVSWLVFGGTWLVILVVSGAVALRQAGQAGEVQTHG